MCNCFRLYFTYKHTHTHTTIHNIIIKNKDKLVSTTKNKRGFAFIANNGRVLLLLNGRELEREREKKKREIYILDFVCGYM